ncbi:meiosis-specific with OB domain-containing protein-like [Acanthaster planci]|uniref:Meiosis-specific with OB domain-containing protein n=1 Tax=Acanthaster planci TaxID=133434 RepID=A0A8B7YCE6_ACAPL|nr:meiosis-specific with OB domain-containing protein-like [Acanthaster planci]
MAWTGGFVNEFGTQEMWPDGTRIQSHPLSATYDVNIALTQLKNISPHAANTIITGVVIAKQQPRSVPSKTDPTTDRGLLSFTLRDSPTDFINGTCWGSESYICELATKFKIGDIVEIRNPQIQSKQNTEQEERYRPWTPSQYQLTLSEKYSTLSLYGGWNVDVYSTLQHIPIRESDNYYTLADVIANGQGLHGDHINVLVLLKTIGTPKDIVTKTGKKIKRCEVKMYDETCHAFPLVIWDTENIDLVQRWKPHETVVFATDIMVKFDNFRSCMTGTVGSKTIFITNPDTYEAHSLFKFGQSRDTNDDQTDEDSGRLETDLSSIKEVYKVDQIKYLAVERPDGSNGADYGITYAFLAAFDIDSTSQNCISMRCSSCKRRVESTNFSCINPNCLSSVSGQPETTMTFDILTDFSDATGTLKGCYLGGTYAEEMLQCTAGEFLHYTEQQKTDLKWRFLLERCKVYFKVFRYGANSPRRIVRILSCNPAQPTEILPHL